MSARAFGIGTVLVIGVLVAPHGAAAAPKTIKVPEPSAAPSVPSTTSPSSPTSAPKAAPPAAAAKPAAKPATPSRTAAPATTPAKADPVVALPSRPGVRRPLMLDVQRIEGRADGPRVLFVHAGPQIALEDAPEHPSYLRDDFTAALSSPVRVRVRPYEPLRLPTKGESR
ncbi:MAG: hypothetical protein ACREOU_11910 [Candidatus Eiseniibacteriota bacterium]